MGSFINCTLQQILLLVVLHPVCGAYKQKWCGIVIQKKFLLLHSHHVSAQIGHHQVDRWNIQMMTEYCEQVTENKMEETYDRIASNGGLLCTQSIAHVTCRLTVSVTYHLLSIQHRLRNYRIIWAVILV
jgi:hypothetical protein